MTRSRTIDLIVRRYLTPPWTGPVVRRDPDVVRTTSVHLTWKCPRCWAWPSDGAYLRGVCNWCGEPRPAR